MRKITTSSATVNQWPLRLLWFALAMLIGNGCRSAGTPAAARFAAVTIWGNTPGQIRDTAVAVFAEHGYKVAQTDPDNLVFEKQGSRMSDFAYGSWLGDVPVWIRVKAAIVPAGEMTSRLQCHAYLVHDKGSAAEEEVALSRLRRGPYQKLLEEVAARFSRK